MNSNIKNLILKIGMAILATLVAGNGYELLNEVRELRSQAERTERAFTRTAEAFELVSNNLTKVRGAVDSAGSQCGEARNEGLRIRSSIEGLREQIEELRRKLRLQTKVIPDNADRSSTDALAPNVSNTN